jgi:hypothetical protein
MIIKVKEEHKKQIRKWQGKMTVLDEVIDRVIEKRAITRSEMLEKMQEWYPELLKTNYEFNQDEITIKEAK